MWSAEVHVRRATSLAALCDLRPAQRTAHVVSTSQGGVLALRRRLSAGAAIASSADSPRAPTRCASPRECGVSWPDDAFAGPPHREPTGWPGWHEPCTRAPATGTRYAAGKSKHLKDGSSANRFFDMRSHYGAGFQDQHRLPLAVRGSASCRLKLHKSKKVCRGQGANAAGPRSLCTRSTRN